MGLYETFIPISFEKMRSIQIDLESYNTLTSDGLIDDYTIYEERYKGACYLGNYSYNNSSLLDKLLFFG